MVNDQTGVGQAADFESEAGQREGFGIATEIAGAAAMVPPQKFVYSAGRITVSITWITPFDASMSAVVTVAPLTLTPSDRSIVRSPP